HLRVKFRVRSPPDLPVAPAFGGARRAEPEVEQRRRRFVGIGANLPRHAAFLSLEFFEGGMARKRIFSRKRSRRWPLGAAVSLGFIGAVSAAWLTLAPANPPIPACSAEEVRRDLRDMLRGQAAAEVGEVEVVALSESRRVFRRDRMQARDCAARAQVDGSEETIRFRIT